MVSIKYHLPLLPQLNRELCLTISIINSEPGADQLPLDTEHLHLQSQNIPNN